MGSDCYGMGRACSRQGKICRKRGSAFAKMGRFCPESGRFRLGVVRLCEGREAFAANTEDFGSNREGSETKPAAFSPFPAGKSSRDGAASGGKPASGSARLNKPRRSPSERHCGQRVPWRCFIGGISLHIVIRRLSGEVRQKSALSAIYSRFWLRPCQAPYAQPTKLENRGQKSQITGQRKKRTAGAPTHTAALPISSCK